MKIVMMVLLCLQLGCKLELPKEVEADKDKEAEGKIVFLGRIKENIDVVTVVNYDHNIPNIPLQADPKLPDEDFKTQMLPPPYYANQTFDWDFQINRLRLSGNCNLERTISKAENESLTTMIRSFDFCQYEGPERFPCPCYFGPLNEATVYAGYQKFEMIRSPDDCTGNRVICDPADNAKLNALIEQLTANDIENCD